jgi:hypothetical protein
MCLSCSFYEYKTQTIYLDKISTVFHASRDLEIGRNLGQGANSFDLDSLKPGLANHEHEGTPIFVRFLACRLRFFMILQQNTDNWVANFFSAIAQKDWRSSQSSCFQHTLIIYEILNHQETGGQNERSDFLLG